MTLFERSVTRCASLRKRRQCSRLSSDRLCSSQLPWESSMHGALTGLSDALSDDCYTESYLD